MIDQNSPLQALGARLRAQFDQVRGERLALEERWLKDLRQYKGVYDPEEASRFDKKQAQTFRRLTRIKVKSATSRLMDLMFPAGSDDNWAIEPTPKPSMWPNEAMLVGMMAALGRPPTPQEVQLQIQVEAKAAADAMQDQIRDQLTEVRYRAILKDVIQSGNLFGTGLVKGPLVNRAVSNRWVMNPTGQWVMQTAPVLTPWMEFVPIWEWYPDSSACHVREARYSYQRMPKARHELLELAKRPDFMGDVIREYVRSQREGDITPTHWELELRRLGWNIASVHPRLNRYELLDFWGVIEPRDLEAAGIELPISDDIDELWANVFLLGNRVIKAELQPIDGVSLPYYAYYWDKDETSIFGEGIPAIMRDDQKGLNASVRAMLDNAAICAGPQFEANVDLLHPDEDPQDVHPRKVWLRQGVGAESQYPALRAVDVPSHTAEYLQMAGDFANSIHEATLPSYMHGEATSKGSVGRTVGGLSLLMTAAQITFKDQLFCLDDEVQKPVITALYHWNMQFNPDPSIKGDFDVKVRGTSSLVAREIRAQNLEAFAAATMNPYDAPFIDRHALALERAKVQELGDKIVLSKDQALTNQLLNPMVESGALPNQGASAPAQESADQLPPAGDDNGIPGVAQAA